MVFLFQHMLSQNYTMSNGFLNATNPYPSLPEFQAPTWAIRVNVLWFSSLVVSLAAASYGMLVKQWLREYLNMAGNTSPRERLRARQYRRPALDRWMVFEIAALLPLLLEIALGLFFVGLCYFTTAIHSSISRSTIPFVAAWAFFFLAATIAPLILPRCPFKTTILKRGRRGIYTLAKACVPLYLTLRNTGFHTVDAGRPIYRTLSHMGSHTVDAGRHVYRTLSHMGTSAHAYLLRHSIVDYGGWYNVLCANIVTLRNRCYALAMGTSFPHFLVLGTPQEIKVMRDNLDTHMGEEKAVLKERLGDMEILRSVEEIMPGDGLLPTLVDVATAANPPWDEAFELMKTIIDNRTGRAMSSNAPSTWNDNLQLLSQQSCDALTGWVSNIISRHQATPSYEALTTQQFDDCVALFFSLISSHTRPLPGPRQSTLCKLIFSMKIDFELFPFHSHLFRRRVKQLFSSLDTDKARMGFTEAELAKGVEALVSGCDNMTDREGDIFSFDDHWIAHALILLVSVWKAPSPHSRPKKYRSPHPLPNRLIGKLLDELCRIDRRGRIFDLNDARVDVFYGILLGGATSEQGEWLYSLKLFARNISSICMLDYAPLYVPGKHDGPTSPKKAFFTLMQSHSDRWVATLLGWLVPGRMPGNILAEIVAADLAASEPHGGCITAVIIIVFYRY